MAADRAAEVLLDALRARGEAPCLEVAGEAISARTFVDWIEICRGEIQDLPLRLPPGSVVAVRGLDPHARFAVPLAAWSLGLHVYFVNEREPEMVLPALLAEAGCSAYVERSDGGVRQWAGGPGDLVLEGPASTLLRTSGSSGRPKIAVHALAQHLESARGAIAFFGLGEADRWLLSLPPWHVGGLAIVLRALLSGAVLCVPGFDVPLPRAITAAEPTHLSLVATQLRRLQDGLPWRYLKACRAVLLGGGPLPPFLRAWAVESEVPLVVSYGATETSALVAASAEPQVVLQPLAAGRALPGRTIRVTERGAIRVAGPTVFRGYLRDGHVHDVRGEDGAFDTGDVGRLDADGILHVSGRSDRMFISGGENVHPEEIELQLAELDGVAEAHVVPVSSAEFGQRPAAFVRAWKPVDVRALAHALRQCLPGYKIPEFWYRMPPRAASLKPDLRELRRRAAHPDTLEPL